ncbi:hypothetical protein GC176_21775 [bacterium]|nr:hypothetical protein [bacterium]
METRFVLEPVWSWPLVTLAAIALPLLVLLTYPQRVRHLPPRTRRFLISLRLLAAGLLVVAMLRPELRFTEKKASQTSLAVLLDSSRSMTTPDGPGGITRREAALERLTASSQLLEKLGSLTSIRYFDFDSELRALNERPAADDKAASAAAGEQSAIGYSLEALERDLQGERLIGALILSDGAQRALPPVDSDPRSAATRLAQVPVPLFPVPFGASAVSGSTLNVAVEDLTVSPVVSVKNVVPVSAKIHVEGAANQEFAVQLLVEDRNGRPADQDGDLTIPPAGNGARPSVRIAATRASQTIPVELSYIPHLPGEFRIAIRVVPLDGELKTTDNERQTLVTVRKGGVSVAYFDTARDEQIYIRQVNSSQQIQLDYYWARVGDFADRSQIEPDLFLPGRYDVYIIGDVPAAAFGSENLKQLARRIENDGAGLLMTAGFYTFGAGGYGTPPLDQLEPLLPVVVTAQDALAARKIDESLQIERPLQMLPTEAGLRHFVMRLSNQDNLTAWQKLPPLFGAMRLEKRNALVDVLAQSDDGVPLLFALSRGRSRVMAFAGDTTWRWYTHYPDDFRAEHQRFWRQVILWLARKELESEQPVWVQVDPRNFDPGAQVPIELGVRDNDGQPVSDAEVAVRLTKPDGTERDLAALRSGDRWLSDFNETQEPGIYRVTVTATRDGQPVPGEAATRFMIDARDLELDNPAADPALLEDLALTTGGRMIKPEDLATFLQELIDRGVAQREDKRITRLTLWDNWGFLLTFVTAVSVEWFLRKRRGLV